MVAMIRKIGLWPPAIRVVGGLSLGLGAALFVSAAEPPKGLVLHFNFDKADTAGTIPDGSGQNNNAKSTGARWTSTGKKGGGYELNPTNSCIRVANSPSLTVKQATFSTWFKILKSDSACRRILNRGQEGAFSLSVGGDPADANAQGKLTVRINGRQVAQSDNAVADGQWHSAAATFDGKELRLYVDGQLQKQVVPCAADAVPGSGDLTLGMAKAGAPPQAGGQSLDGVIDEVMVFNRALSADEVKAAVLAVDPNPGKPKFTKSQVAGRLRQLKLLYEEGLLTDEFYAEKVKECEAAD